MTQTVTKPMIVATTPTPSAPAAELSWPPPQGRWTYADYARLPQNGMRYEVIEGALCLSPAPRPRHQRAIGSLYFRLRAYLESRPVGEVFVSPVDVRFPSLADSVQPDLVFIAAGRSDLVTERWIEGVPDLLVEVLSPGNPEHDRRTKFDVYARAGVREYWVVDPDARMIEVNVLRGRAYALVAAFGADEQVRSEVLPDLVLTVGDVCTG